jgi:hypothetical protein
MFAASHLFKPSTCHVEDDSFDATGTEYLEDENVDISLPIIHSTYTDEIFNMDVDLEALFEALSDTDSVELVKDAILHVIPEIEEEDGIFDQLHTIRIGEGLKQRLQIDIHVEDLVGVRAVYYR